MTIRKLFPLVFVAVAAVACSEPQQVAAPERVLYERLCSECAITTDTALSIPRGDGAVSDQLSLAVGPDGIVVGVDPALHPGRVLLFGPDGRIAAHADVGHLVTQGVPFFDPEGELLVPDERHGTIQVLTPSLKPVRTFATVDYPHAGIVLPGGVFVVNAMSRTPERAGHALHLLNPGDGRVTSMDRSDIRQAGSHELKRFPGRGTALRSGRCTRPRTGSTSGMPPDGSSSLCGGMRRGSRAAGRQSPRTPRLRPPISSV